MGFRRLFIRPRLVLSRSRRLTEFRVGRVATRYFRGRRAVSIISFIRSRASWRLRDCFRCARASIIKSPSTVIRLCQRCLIFAFISEDKEEFVTFQRNCTAVATLLTFCPPGPPARMNVSDSSQAGTVTFSLITRSVSAVMHTVYINKPFRYNSGLKHILFANGSQKLTRSCTAVLRAWQRLQKGLPMKLSGKTSGLVASLALIFATAAPTASADERRNRHSGNQAHGQQTHNNGARSHNRGNRHRADRHRGDRHRGDRHRSDRHRGDRHNRYDRGHHARGHRDSGYRRNRHHGNRHYRHGYNNYYGGYGYGGVGHHGYVRNYSSGYYNGYGNSFYQPRYHIGGHYSFGDHSVILRNYDAYGLYAPPHGYSWVRDNGYNDAVLASLTTGAIIGFVAGALAGH